MKGPVKINVLDYSIYVRTMHVLQAVNSNHVANCSCFAAICNASIL